MDGSIFFFLGGVLVVAALVIAYIGIRGRNSFPPSRGAMSGGLIVFGLLVAGTAAYAVANAREEEEHRSEELAKEEAEAAEEVGAGEQAEAPPGGAPAGGPPAGGAPSGGAPSAEATLDLASPEDGSLVFDPDALQASPGAITLAYDNPSAVPHSVAIQDDQDQVLAESEVVSAALTEATADLVPGEYIFYCTVPGHRESGMEGVLTVQ